MHFEFFRVQDSTEKIWMGLIILPAKFTDFLFAWKQTFSEFFFLRNKKVMLDYKYWSRFI